MPLFSIITPTYQSAERLVPTIESVLAQPDDLFEHIIVDGGSTDGTRRVIEQFHHASPHLRSISEPDAGIYDAMNKGVRMSTGRFLYFLGAGDRLRSGVLETVAAEVGELQTKAELARPLLLYGHVSWLTHHRPPPKPSNRFGLLGSNICHQAIFYERSIFSRLGSYDTEYKLLADWAYNIRVFNDKGIAKHYLPLQIADYEGGGASSQYDDAFFTDFRRLVRHECSTRDALLMRLAFLLTHPRTWIRRALR